MHCLAGTVSPGRNAAMSNEHVRTARVIDPVYLRRPRHVVRRRAPSSSTPNASSSRRRCRTCGGSHRPASTSSRPRSGVAQRRRVDGGPDQRPPRDPRRHRPTLAPRPSSHFPLQMAPALDSEWAPELEEFDGLLANLPILSDEGLVDSIDRLRLLERDVSYRASLAPWCDRPHRPAPRRAPQRPVAACGTGCPEGR